MTRKKIKLSVADKFYIDGNLDKPVEDLADDINCSVKCINVYLEDKLSEQKNKEEEKKKEEQDKSLKETFLKNENKVRKGAKSDVVQCQTPDGNEIVDMLCGRRKGSVVLNPAGSEYSNPKTT